MKKSERLELLLRKGYFPEGLPPPFNSDGLADNSKALRRLWKTLKPKKSKWQKYNIPRAGGHRRFYAITNPVSQFYLSQLIAYEWPKIKAFTNKSIFALDKISFPIDGSRAVTQTDFGALDLRRLEISSYNDLTLNMDISRFYPTLYTHAIPWALHSKEWCKQQKFNSDKYRETLGAKLDFYVRQTQEDQTLGIPIGPDTSRVLSEIVAVAVELKFIELIEKNKITGVRNYDDVAIGVISLAKAEKFKFAFEQALNHFELQLNQEKTNIISSDQPIDRPWSSQLSAFVFRGQEKKQRSDLDHYFSLVFDLSSRLPADNVLNYAIKRISTITIAKDNWSLFEAYLLKMSRANGTCIPRMVQIFANYNYKKFPLNKKMIQKFITDMIARHAPVNHHSELAWSLFLAKALHIKLSAKQIEPIYRTNCSVCALLTLDLEKMGLITGVVYKKIWREFLTSENLYSDMWLLAYEAYIKGWISPKDKNFVANDQFFKTLKELHVSFYDAQKNVPLLRQNKKKATSKTKPKKNLKSANVEDYFDDLTIGDDFGDDFYEY